MAAGLRVAAGGEFHLSVASPTLDRWFYPFNFSFPPDDRPVAPTFASFDPRFDTRDAQFLLGWDTAALVPAHAAPKNYLVRRARVTVVATTDRQFIYDPTFDSYLTYATNQPGYVVDGDPGRPIELYGAGFRNGFTAASFKGDSYYGPLNPISSGNISIGTRSAYAAMIDTNGVLIDVSNNVGQANAAWTQAPFEVTPWAIGQTTNAVPGEYVPADSVFTFDVDFRDPWVVAYWQSALSEGQLRLVISSLSPAVQVTPGGTANGGSGSYPTWSTRRNLVYDVPLLELDGVFISDEDTDHDGLPDDWERFYFGDLHVSGADDTDGDGMSNAAEYRAGTNPIDASSRLAILRSSFDSNGSALLEFSFAPSRNYRVESSVDLVSWSTAHGVFRYPAPGLARFQEESLTVPPGLSAHRYFRVVVD